MATELLEAKVLAATAVSAEVLAVASDTDLTITTITTEASVAAASEVVVGSKASFRP